MFILETSYTEKCKQKIYNILTRPDPGSSEWTRHATKINCFFHRHARDGLKYNITNIRQFTRHDEDEREFYKWPWLTYEDVATLDDFFALVGFDYRNKAWQNKNETSKRFPRKKK